MVQLTLILDNVRSTHNVGAILRTADATGVVKVVCAGITPYPRVAGDNRDPVVSGRHTREIAKTALGAEASVTVEHVDATTDAIAACRADGCTIYGLEQAPNSLNLLDFEPPADAKLALIVGNEPNGITDTVLAECDHILELPQRGAKESLNVAVAAGVAMYKLMY